MNNTTIAIVVLAVLIVAGTALWWYSRRLDDARLLRRKPHQLAESLEPEPEPRLPTGDDGSAINVSPINITSFGDAGGGDDGG